MQGLLLAGVAMTVLGQTTPISGWEHAISHAIDLWAAHTGRDHGLHGIQVGAASWVSARYFAALIDHFDADRIDPRTWYQTREQAERDLRQHWSGWIKNPETLDELWHDAEAKWQQWRGNRDALEAFAKAWRTGEPADTLQQLVKPPSFFEQAITRVRAAETLLDATPNFAADIACRILQGAHLVRRRFTVGDVLAPLGWINGPSPDVRR
jgi:glycerol-1-phosphate dehydrogenase [NAD(P)+]